MAGKLLAFHVVNPCLNPSTPYSPTIKSGVISEYKEGLNSEHNWVEPKNDKDIKEYTLRVRKHD